MFHLNVNTAVFAQLILISWGLNTTLFHNEINIYIYHIYHPQEKVIIEWEQFNNYSVVSVLPGLKWASTKARRELLGARFRTRTLMKSLRTSDFLNRSLTWWEKWDGELNEEKQYTLIKEVHPLWISESSWEVGFYQQDWCFYRSTDRKKQKQKNPSVIQQWQWH